MRVALLSLAVVDAMAALAWAGGSSPIVRTRDH